MLGGWPPNFSESMSAAGVLSWNAIANATGYRVYAFRQGTTFPVSYPNHRDVWAGAFINNAPDDSANHGGPDRAILSIHTPPLYLTIEDFTFTSNTHVMTMIADAYIELPADVLEINVNTIPGLTDGETYVFRIQAMAPPLTGAPVTVPAPIGDVPWADSRLSGVIQHPTRANIVLDVYFPAFTINTQRLDTPQNLRFVNVSTDGLGSGSGGHTTTGHRAIEWDPVPGAIAYRIYAYCPISGEVYRTQLHTGREEMPRWGATPGTTNPNTIPDTTAEVPMNQFNIGHEGVQARTRFNMYWPNDMTNTGPVINADGELAYHAIMASTRQSFDLPLPYRPFDFRVIAVASPGSLYLDSLKSEPITATPGARSLHADQVGALVDDAIARGAGGRGFIQIDTGTQGGAGTVGVIYIPLTGGMQVGGHDYMWNDITGEPNRDFFARAAIEIRNHPAYIGPETLIFTT